MINRVLLVAAREFRQIAATRSFWITLLIIPFSLAIGPIASHFFNQPAAKTVMLIDPARIEAPAIAAQLKLDEQRQVLAALSRYAERHDLQRTAPGAPWARRDRWFGDRDVTAFMRSGGERAALAAMAPAIKPDTPPFARPMADFRIVSTPPELATATPAALAKSITARLDPPKGSTAQKLDYAVYVPPSFGTGRALVRLWTNGAPDPDLMEALDRVLTRDLRTRFLTSHGLDAGAADAASMIASPVAITSPPMGQGRERMVIRSVLPLITAYLLFLSLMLSGQWMLQGLVEERSNKLLEAVLACVSPSELMHGKLIGTVAVGLTMILFWVGCGIGAAFATQGMIADLLRPALAPLTSPGVAAAMIYFFVTGYIMVSMIFLAIGAISDSFREAQGYLTPVILVIMMPFVIMASAVIRNPDSIGVRIMTWIPLYTPFTMLARLGQGVPVWEILGAGILLAAFIALEFVMLGRVFRQSLLNAGDKPGLAQLARMMRTREAE